MASSTQSQQVFFGSLGAGGSEDGGHYRGLHGRVCRDPLPVHLHRETHYGDGAVVCGESRKLSHSFTFFSLKLKTENSFINYSPLCRTKSIRHLLIFETQMKKDFVHSLQVHETKTLTLQKVYKDNPSI